MELFTKPVEGFVYSCCLCNFETNGLYLQGSSGRDLCAIKCMYTKGLGVRSCDNLISEISILKKMKHDFIVEMLDFQWDANFIYIIFEFCSEGDLSVFIHRRKSQPGSWRISECLVRYFLQQLASALQFLHQHKVSHFDLKPSNILLSRKNTFNCLTLKLADFGFSKSLSCPDETNDEIRGTPLYMAPEILMKRKYDSRADLWSVGIILYEIIFGKTPFNTSSIVKLAAEIRSDHEIKIPSTYKISSTCHDLLVQLLQRDPGNRISFEAFFEHSFLDLKHVPCFKSYQAGCNLIAEAVNKDGRGEVKDAIKLYVDGLQYLIPILTWGLPINEETKKLDLKKQAFRDKLASYMDRVELLKQKTNDISSKEEMILYEAYESCQEADSLADSGLYSEALVKFQRSLQVALSIVKKYKSGDKREEYLKQIDKWLSRAEELKKKTQRLESENNDKKPEQKPKWISLKKRKRKYSSLHEPVILKDEISDSISGCRVQ